MEDLHGAQGQHGAIVEAGIITNDKKPKKRNRQAKQVTKKQSAASRHNANKTGIEGQRKQIRSGRRVADAMRTRPQKAEQSCPGPSNRWVMCVPGGDEAIRSNSRRE